MPRLTTDQIDEALVNLPDWRREGDELLRDCTFRDAVEAIGFIVQVAALQERVDHHATITWTYADVTLALSTHDEGGISERDVALAREIEERIPALGD